MIAKKMIPPEEIFAELGFNALESEVYIALLRHGPQTAYKIGKLLNRATANVYKAVDILAAKGAIELDTGETRICKAIPIASLTRQLEHEYGKRTSRAVAALGSLEPHTSIEGITALLSVDAVLQRAREMLDRSKKTVVADFFPEPLRELRPQLEAAVNREVIVRVQAYSDVEIDGAILVIPAVHAEMLTRWKAQQLNLAVDGSEILVALFNQDMTQLIQANYSNNLYLSCILYSGMKYEHLSHRMDAVQSMEELVALRAQQATFLSDEVPGIQQLFMQYK